MLNEEQKKTKLLEKNLEMKKLYAKTENNDKKDY